jgi:GNAT superfamily N-acetyltransferase
MADVRIRPAAADDSADLAGLIAQLGHEATPDEVAERLAAMQTEGTAVLVADIEGVAVGCLATAIMRTLHRPALVGRVSLLVVDEPVRGRGIGAALIRAAEEALAAQGCYMIEITSNFSWVDAHRFYERLGYEKTSFRLMRML